MEVQFKQAFVLAFGNSILGTTLYGPFRSRQEAQDCGKELALPLFSIPQISMVTPVTVDVREPIWTKAIGNPFDKMELNSLYQNVAAANPVQSVDEGAVTIMVKLIKPF